MRQHQFRIVIPESEIKDEEDEHAGVGHILIIRYVISQSRFLKLYALQHEK